MMKKFNNKLPDPLLECTTCPRNCRVNRSSSKLGFCKTGVKITTGSICAHRGEEPVISGVHGICNIFFTQYLAAVIEKKGLSMKTASVHPGVVNTEFSRFADNYPFYVKFLYYGLYPFLYLVTKSPIAGAQTTLALCYMDFEKIQNGQYYTNTVITDTSEMAKNPEIRQEVINYSWALIDKITSNKDFKIPKFD